MSKRSAQGPQGDKDTDLFNFNMNSTPDDKPQRATAAQLANRKILKGRTARAPRPSTGTPGSFGGPFSSIDPNTVSSPSANQQPTNGFTFGQSQSFPPTSSNPPPQAQNGGSQFSFGSGGGAPSFNFSASLGGAASQPASNPFASMNTGGATQQQNGTGFTGFNGSMFNVPASGSQSPAQQPLPSGGMFGAGSQQKSSTGGMFGGAANSAPSFQSGTPAPSNGNMFGQTTTSAPSTTLFGHSSVDKPNPFAQNSAFGNDSMQTSPDAKAAAQKPSLFSSGTGGFGVSTNFGSTGTGNLFGGTSPAPAETPSKPLFGAKPAEQTASSSTPLFGAPASSTPAASAAPSFGAAPSTTGTSTSSLFSSSTSKPATSTQNLFQSSTNLFGAPSSSATEKPSEEKPKEDTKASQSSLFQPAASTSSTTPAPSLFSKSATAAPTLTSTPSQPPSTGSLFAPKPASNPAEPEMPQANAGNPFSSLFVPKSSVIEKPATEQKSLPSSSNLFSPKPASTEPAKANDLSKASTSASPFSAPTLSKPSSPAPQTPAFSFSKPQASSSAPTFTPPAASSSPFKVNGTKPDAAPASPSATVSPVKSFDKLQPAKMPSILDKGTQEEVESVYRLRLLNECLQRELAKLEPGTHDFDTVIQFYLRVRDTIGAPLEGAGTKRKASVDSSEATNVQSSKKLKPFGVTESPAPAAGSPSAAPKPTPSTSSKRKAAEDDDDKDASASPSSKRASGGDSTTASIFANSFSRSKNSESDEPAGASSPKKLDAPSFKPSTPEASKPSLFSTTPTSSPPKPTFSSSTAPKESSAAKPLFTAPSSGTPAASPFTLKPSGEKSASFPAPTFAIPKFGSGGTTNFMSQFKAQSDKDAEKEKAKRKAEDFDSDEDDEAEWERKDAENQRKKREELQAQQNRRAKFIPGKGFSFDEEVASTDEEKSDTSPSASVLDSKTSSFGKSSNIFGHLSATPSESGNDEHDDADDTEEDSASADDAEDPTFAPNADVSESSSVSSKANGTLESSDEGDFLKALKKSKQAEKPDDKEQASGGRSLFDRVEYGEDGKPKRQGEDDKNASSILGSSKFASSFNSSSSTPNPFASLTQYQSEKSESSTPKPASNPFGASASSKNIFGGSSSGSGASTPSIFATGSSATKPGSDNTWKVDSPIKFASDTTPAKSDSTSTAPAAAPSNPFSTLFGASSTGSKPGSSGSQGTAGFSFGGPSQPASSSLMTPSILSGTPSRASTPGVASDTGAEDSGDGEAAESLPQVNLSRGGAGEENEDVVFEVARCRAMRLDDKPPAKAGEPPKKEWETIGMGNLRILKDKTTSRTRILVRADPSGNVLLNTRLMKEIKYTLNGTYINFLVPQADGPPKQWTIRGKKEEAPSIVAAMEKYKS